MADGSIFAVLRYQRTRLLNLPAERLKGATYFDRSAMSLRELQLRHGYRAGCSGCGLEWNVDGRAP